MQLRSWSLEEERGGKKKGFLGQRRKEGSGYKYWQDASQKFLGTAEDQV